MAKDSEAAATEASKEEPKEVAPEAAVEASEAAPPAAAAADAASAADVAPADVPAGGASAAGEPAAAAAEAAEAAEPPATEAAAEPAEEVFTYEDHEDVPGSFKSAREAVGKMHGVLDKLLACKQSGGDAESFSEHARMLQRELLTLRRTHRYMVKASDQGRSNEAASRRKVDAALGHLEMRRYESGCLRTAAKRCRTFPTPELNKLRPNLSDGAFIEGDDPDEEDEQEGTSTASSGLSKRLEAERTEREKLDAELQELERVKEVEAEAINELLNQKTEFANLVRNGLRAFEPALNHLELLPRAWGSSPPDVADALASLPTPLRVVYAKFDNIATFSEGSGVSVSIEGARPDGPPPEKKAKSDRTTTVCVQISNVGNQATASKAVNVHFGCHNGSIVKVFTEKAPHESFLESVWPEDNGLKTVEPEDAAELRGRAFYWAQILAGLRDTVSTSAPSLAALDGISAMDVVTKVRARMAGKTA